MKILYLHGLEAVPHPQKMAVLEKRGHEVFAPHIQYKDYKNTDEIFVAVEKMAVEYAPEFIVGSSFGGFFGYWLGHSLGAEQLLFNPALCYNSMLMPTPSHIQVREELCSWVVLGAKDETISPELNANFFENKPFSRVITCQWLGHRIDLATFEESVRWAGL